MVERLGAEAGLDRVADAVVAAVDPREDLERLAGHEHVARADDRPPRLVDVTSAVIVYLWSWSPCSCLGERGVDLDLHDVPSGPTATSFSTTTSGGSCWPPPPPRRNGPAAAPLVPAGIPRVVVREPPVAGAVEPVPRRGGIPVLRRACCAVTLYFTLALVPARRSSTSP